MKIWVFEHTPNIYESEYALISLHTTKQGAEAAKEKYIRNIKESRTADSTDPLFRRGSIIREVVVEGDTAVDYFGTSDIELPPLPPPFKKAVYATSANTKNVRDGVEMGGYEKEPPLFDDAQMHEYARAAVEADRKRRGEPVLYAAPDFAEVCKVRNGYTLCSKKPSDLHTAPLYTTPQSIEADKVRELEAKYSELIMAVASKCPNETRHQTALRYIKNAESKAGQDNKPFEAKKGE